MAINVSVQYNGELLPDIILFKRKFRTHLDLLSIPQLGEEKMSKRLGWIKGCKYKTSSWHLNGFPDGPNVISIGEPVYMP